MKDKVTTLKASRVLLLDFDKVSVQGKSIKQIIETSSRLNIATRHECIQSDRSDQGRVSSIISSFKPHLIMLVVPKGLLKSLRARVERLRQEQFGTPIIIAYEADDPDEMFDLFKLDIADFLTPPLDAASVLPRVWRSLEREAETERARQAQKEIFDIRQIVGESPALRREVDKISVIADCDTTVLIVGETGTGKELFARSIHYLSRRAGKGFIPVNCGAIPIELVENELFGHERGAFTGASSSHSGLIHESNGGTLFLDEIDSLPLMAQVKLLRFIQEKEFRPLGSTRTIKADVRIIAASSVNFEEAVRAGRLRQDLYYRLNVIRLTLPPLRQRREDILMLARLFLTKYAVKFNRPANQFSPESLLRLTSYDWPGNVRELEHAIERAVVLSGQAMIENVHIVLPGAEFLPLDESFQEMKARVINQFERTYIEMLLLAHKGNISKAATTAKKDRRAFVHLIRKHKISAHEFKRLPSYDSV